MYFLKLLQNTIVILHSFLIASNHANLSSFKAGVLLNKYPKALACTMTICRNGSTCLNLGKLAKLTYRVEHCFCAKKYYGPRCEFEVETRTENNRIENNRTDGFSQTLVEPLIHMNEVSLKVGAANFFMLACSYTLLVVLLTAICFNFCKSRE